jgi:diacylglycerol O-acyltransferase
VIEMAGADAYFLWEESRARHMHTLKVIVLDARSAYQKLSFERVVQGASLVLPHLAAFRRRAVPAPLGIGHPLWVDAPVHDPDYHFRHEVLPPGAGSEALDELLGRIASEPLDRDRPLWQIFFVEGLPGGRVAYVTKLHHAVADGPAAAELVLRSFQLDASTAPDLSGYERENEPIPSAGRRLLRSLRRELIRQKELPGLVARSLRATGVTLRWRREGRALPPSPFSTPATPFNRPLTPNRVYSHVTLSLTAMKEVKVALECTLNDVFLAVVGGALRRYLANHEERRESDLTAAVPVSVRREEDDATFGNATAYWFASTASHVADPIERVHAVARGTRTARAHFEARDPYLPVDWLEHWPLRRFYLTGFAALVGLIARRPSYNVIVSNVRGPSKPLYSDGARIDALFSMGPLTLHQGLNFTAWSYLDDFSVGIHACREHVPNVRTLADDLRDEMDLLWREATGTARSLTA